MASFNYTVVYTVSYRLARYRRATLLMGYLLIPSLACLPFLLLGVPGFQHDWSWPVDARQFNNLAHTYAAPWNPQSLGAENVRRSLSPTITLVSVLGSTFGPRLGLVAFVALSILVAICAAAILARDVGAGRFAALLVGVLYGTSPQLYYRIAAGHSFVWFDYALLPLIPWASYRRRNPALVVTCVALVVACGSSQGEMLLVTLLLAGACAVLFASWPTASGALLGVILSAPTFMAVANGLHSGQLSSSLATFPSWEINNSIPVRFALLGIGYFTGSFELAVPWANDMWYWVALAGALALLGLGLFFARARMRLLIAILIACGIVCSTAARGPWAGFAFWLYKFPAIDTLRDPYNLATLTEVGVVIAAAMASRSRIFFLLLAPLLCAQVWAFTVGFYSLPRAHFTTDDESVLSALAQAPGDASFLYLPMGGRLVSGNHQGSEYWPSNVGQHSSINAYFDEGIDLSLELALATHAIDPSRALAAAGVEWVVERNALRSQRDFAFIPDSALERVLSTPTATLWRNLAYSGRPIFSAHCAVPVLFSNLIRMAAKNPYTCAKWSMAAAPFGESQRIERDWIPYTGDLVRPEFGVEAGVAPAMFAQRGVPYPLPPVSAKESIDVCASGSFQIVAGRHNVPMVPVKDAKQCHVTAPAHAVAFLVPYGPVVIYGFRSGTRTVRDASRTRAHSGDLAPGQKGPRLGHLAVEIPAAIACLGYAIILLMLSRASFERKTAQ